ncbi:MAG: DUF4124 domain-containing protein, partial [Chromatiales bacterium]|nr:DUF4124 domain-containing protein [Chromatiales bacterium]
FMVSAQATSIYRWTDKTGQVHYTRTPPHKSMTSKKVERQNDSQVPTARIEDSPIIKQPTIEPPETIEMSAAAKRRQALCESAQYQLNEMRRTDKVIENGHEIEITDDERKKRMKAQEQAVKEYCSQPQPQPTLHPQLEPLPKPKQ